MFTFLSAPKRQVEKKYEILERGKKKKKKKKIKSFRSSNDKRRGYLT